MKSDLIINRFKTEPTIGTKSTLEEKTFFGSKMIDIEDQILIDESYIQYSEIFNTGDTNNNGYQYYDDIDYLEKIYLVNLTDSKYLYHSINLMSQTNMDLQNNTNWTILINWKDILTDYLYYKLKEARTFKCIRYTDIISENINLYIRDYIKTNLINRYKFVRLNLYISYLSLETENMNIIPNLQFDPIFTVSVKNIDNLVKNVNATVFDELINVKYKQTQSSKTLKFNYYFDLILYKI
jgi:hypothetical protein